MSEQKHIGSIAVGDWVRFYRAGVLVIGEVAYLRPVPYFSYRQEVCTTSEGVVSSSSILEVRKAQS